MTAPKLQEEPLVAPTPPSSVECFSEAECSSPMPADDNNDLLEKGNEEVPASSKLQEPTVSVSSSVECMSQAESASPALADGGAELLNKFTEEVPASSNAVNGQDIGESNAKTCPAEIDVSSYSLYQTWQQKYLYTTKIK